MEGERHRVRGGGKGSPWLVAMMLAVPALGVLARATTWRVASESDRDGVGAKP